MLPETEIVGIFGLSLILTAYFLNYQKIVKRDSRAYDLLNLFGGLSLLYYSLALGGLAFVVLQIVWSGLALYHLIKRELPKPGKGRREKADKYL